MAGSHNGHRGRVIDSRGLFTHSRGLTRKDKPKVQGFFSKQRSTEEKLRDERVRLACNLHDGLLQTFAAAQLELETARRLVKTDPTAACARIEIVLDVMTAERQGLSSLIRTLKSEEASSLMSASDVATAIENLCERAKAQWGLRLESSITGRGFIPMSIRDEICRVVQEGLTNVGRHASAETVWLRIAINNRQVKIALADDGCGFTIRGRYDLAALVKRNQGPISLRERVASRRGTLVLTSTASGSQLEISFPITYERQEPAPQPIFSTQ